MQRRPRFEQGVGYHGDSDGMQRQGNGRADAVVRRTSATEKRDGESERGNKGIEWEPHIERQGRSVSPGEAVAGRRGGR